MGMSVIAHTELSSSAAASIIFSSIPQTYTDLLLVVSHRNTGNEGQARIALNDDTGSNYPKIWLTINNGSASFYSDSSNFPFWTPTSGTTANTFGLSEIYFPNYRSSSNKQMSVKSVIENNASTGIYYVLGSMGWNNTAAITKITLSMAAFDYAQYSSATLYGIEDGSSGGVTVS